MLFPHIWQTCVVKPAARPLACTLVLIARCTGPADSTTTESTATTTVEAAPTTIDQADFDFGPARTAVARFPIGDGSYSTAYQLLAPVDDLVYTITISYLDPTGRQTTDTATALSTFQPLR